VHVYLILQLHQPTIMSSLKLSDLEPIIRCPVCFTVPRSGPILECENGHLVCKPCFTRLRLEPSPACPTCRIPMSPKKKRNLLAEQIIAKCDFDCSCKYVDSGCLHLAKKSLIKVFLSAPLDCTFSYIIIIIIIIELN
jgi:hypothetical protein